MAETTIKAGESRPKTNLLYDPEARGLFFQIVTVAIFVWVLWDIAHNVITNLARTNKTLGFDFLSGRAGFDLSQTLIAYSSDSTYFDALVVGLLNTLLVAVCGIITATIIGLLVGVGRLSSNWLVARLCTVYVEVFRNIPPLLVIFFWYKGVLNVLPDVRQSVVLPFDMYLNNRGFAFPKPIFGDGFWLTLAGLVIGIAIAVVYARQARTKQMATGQQSPVLLVSLVAVLGLTIAGFLAGGMPLTFEVPVAGKFNLTGGSLVGPEFLSLYLALSFYTASFIAEIVRAGIRGVAKGQTEAARALGIRQGLTTRLVVLPQALRIIIPPLTSQYLNLTKNSSLAIAAGYADLVAVGGTILNQAGRSIEIVAIWMMVYLSLSLATSLFMNWFNSKMALVEPLT